MTYQAGRESMQEECRKAVKNTQDRDCPSREDQEQIEYLREWKLKHPLSLWQRLEAWCQKYFSANKENQT